MPGGLRVGVYLGWKGTAPAETVDLRAVAKYASGLPAVVFVRDLGRNPRLDLAALQSEIHTKQLNRVVIAGDSPGYFKAAFTRAMVEAGGDPAEVRLASYPRTRRCLRRGDRAGEGHHGLRRPGCALRPRRRARDDQRASRHARHRRRRRRHPGGARDRRRRQEGLPHREDRHHRRSHGDVRQDLSDPRLRRLHPHAEDGLGRSARDDRAVDPQPRWSR